MAFFLKGVHVPHRKNTSDMSPVKMGAPKNVIIPTSMHIGAPAVPVVKKGDKVTVGTLIAEAGNGLSSPIYSGVSGTVSGITDLLMADGRTVPAITIEADGEQTVCETITPPTIGDKAELIKAIKDSGIVGLGGAGFPTYAKFTTDKKIETLIINGAECEPYITSDSITMTMDAEDIVFAIQTLLKYFQIDKAIIGIENNKPNAISAVKTAIGDNAQISVKVLPSVYPQGGEKVLIYHTTGKVVPKGKLPIDVGCVVINSTTTAFIGKYIKTGMPLVEKCVTVDGSAVKEPKNVIVPIGTPLKDVFEFAGGFKSEPKKVLYGGPMMGISVPDMSYPVIKNTNATIAFDEAETVIPKTTACIKCGACINHCPFGINPPAIAKALKNEDFEAMEEAGADLCMECGCCSYVCPASRPLVANNKLAKKALAQHKKKEGK